MNRGEENETEEDLIRDLVRAFVWNPDDVVVLRQTKDPNQQIQIIELNVNSADYGAVVGKMGRKIQALQTVVQFFGVKERKKIRLILPEQERSGRANFPEPFCPNPHWKPEKVVVLLRRTLAKIISQPFQISVTDATDQTHLELAVGKNDRKFVEMLAPSLHTIIRAIGKSEGRDVYVRMPESAPA